VCGGGCVLGGGVGWVGGENLDANFTNFYELLGFHCCCCSNDGV